MNEIGNDFKESRESAGVSIEEASSDTNIPVIALEQIEDGKIGSFKDIFELKDYLTSYSKYLGLDPEETIKKFNEYMFEYTSKIPVDKLEKAIEEKERQEAEDLEMTNEIRVVSPYLKSREKPVWPKYLIISIVIIILIAVSIIWAVKQVGV